MMTFSKWAEVCRALGATGATVLLAREFAEQGAAERPVVVVKHDIEAEPDKALKTAQIESENGLRATYYFHGFFLQDTRAVRCMRAIQQLGHEIGYHYDVLDCNNGDFEMARRQFDKYLSGFANIGVEIETVCPHGNPLKQRDGWNSNKDFFKEESIREQYPKIFDIVNDIPARTPGFNYISDAGFSFKTIADIRDNDKPGITPIGDREVSVADIIEVCERGPVSVISVHSHRMSDFGLALTVRKAIFFGLRRAVRFLTRAKIFRRLLSPLFGLSKRF